MSQTLRLLIVEDNAADAELLVRELTRAGFAPRWKRVDTEDQFMAELAGEYDLVLSDFHLPQFSGMRALELLQTSGRDLPFILVSGMVGEDVAVEAIRRGAADYLLKDRLARLSEAVKRALAEAAERRELARTARELQASEELYRTLVTATPDAVVSLDLNARITFASGRARRLFGFSEEEAVVGSSVLDFIVPADRERAMRNVTRLVQDHWIGVREYTLVRKDGSTFAAEISAGLLVGATNQPTGVMLLARDISARVAADAALRESESRFRQVVESINEVYWMSDAMMRRIIYVSPGFERIWGRKCESWMQNVAIWDESLHPDDRQRMTLAREKLLQTGGSDEFYRIMRPDGTVRWVHGKVFPVRDETGVVRRLVGVIEDITERKKLEEQFLRAQRLEAVGTLAGGIAHDLNNILSPMLMAAPMLRDKLQDPTDLEMLAMIEQSAKRGANIIRQMLTFSRGIAGEKGPVQLRHLIKETVSMITETFPRGITVSEHLDRDLWAINADATQIHQVLMNLCVNARDAMHERGNLTLTARNLTVGVDPAPPALSKPGRYVHLIVADTGEGIPAENRDRIFEPFFTTKEIGKGTGLGLSTVLGIVRGHDGHLCVDSTVGKGTSFHVFFPASHGEERPATVQSVALVRGSGETVLVVDDEVTVRHTLSRVLADHNYRVLAAADGQEALAIFAANRAEVQLLVTDVMMPRLDGVSLVKELREQCPTLRCLAMSGLQDADRRAELTGLGINGIIAKPFTVQNILAAVRRALSADAPV